MNGGGEREIKRQRQKQRDRDRDTETEMGRSVWLFACLTKLSNLFTTAQNHAQASPQPLPPPPLPQFVALSVFHHHHHHHQRCSHTTYIQPTNYPQSQGAGIGHRASAIEGKRRLEVKKKTVWERSKERRCVLCGPVAATREV